MSADYYDGMADVREELFFEGYVLNEDWETIASTALFPTPDEAIDATHKLLEEYPEATKWRVYRILNGMRSDPIASN